MQLNECTSRADLGTAAQQREYILDMIEPRESANPADIRAVLDGSQHRDNAGNDFERMWLSLAMADFFEMLSTDYRTTEAFFNLLIRLMDEAKKKPKHEPSEEEIIIRQRLDRLVTNLEREL